MTSLLRVAVHEANVLEHESMLSAISSASLLSLVFVEDHRKFSCSNVWQQTCCRNMYDKKLERKLLPLDLKLTAACLRWP